MRTYVAAVHQPQSHTLTKAGAFEVGRKLTRVATIPDLNAMMSVSGQAGSICFAEGQEGLLTLNDLQGRDIPGIDLLLLIDLGVEACADSLGNGSAIDLDGSHGWS